MPTATQVVEGLWQIKLGPAGSVAALKRMSGADARRGVRDRAGGLKAIHIPGQCAGQVALLWPRRRLLFAADACANMPTFGYALCYENLEDGKRSLRKLAARRKPRRPLRGGHENHETRGP